ncbi:MAG: transporter [Gammaproteobacteria bacterium]|nr:MAG: transporter [Gammaproteobacteria bacterium]
MQVYLARNNVQAGPYSIEQLNSMLANGDVLQNDLIWHQGMEEWKTIAEVTNGQITYYPDGFVPTVTTHLEQQERTRSKITVDELYGNQPADSVDKPQEPHPVAHVPTKSTMHNKIRKNRAKKAAPTYELASPITRILATLIDNIIMTAAFAPIFFSIGTEKFTNIMRSNTGAVEQARALTELIPNHIANIVVILMLAMFFVQVMLLIRRGQTIGKLITGLRILDKQSKKLASITNVVLIRSIITNIAYSLPFGIIIIGLDILTMFTNKDRQSIHDKLAKTIVVKANDEQIDTQPNKK